MQVYKNNHTISTKCQYQAAVSNLITWFDSIVIFLIKLRVIIKNVDPISTCSP